MNAFTEQIVEQAALDWFQGFVVEIESGRARGTPPGMAAFVGAYRPTRLPGSVARAV